MTTVANKRLSILKPLSSHTNFVKGYKVKQKGLKKCSKTDLINKLTLCPLTKKIFYPTGGVDTVHV